MRKIYQSPRLTYKEYDEKDIVCESPVQTQGGENGDDWALDDFPSVFGS